MATRNQFFSASSLTLAQQVGRMSATYPGFTGRLARNSARWTGTLQPTPISETYSTLIDYALRRRPKVWVIRPNLFDTTGNARIPHMFKDGSVCLHLHADWTPGMFVADTIVPWLSLWLFHYETWRATGIWHGGGHEPRSSTSR
jgi:hypothetical protein